MRVLLIADLEGIPGVDSVTALAVGGAGNDLAIEAMHAETLKVVSALHGVGVDHIRISDAHRSGADFNLDPRRFPPSCEVRFTDDMYGGPLLDGVDAVCAVGMHARAQSGGFAGHTVSLHTGWALGTQVLNESMLAQLLAAERGIPTWFTCGDDVLATEVKDAMPCVVTKHSRSTTSTISRASAAIDAELNAVIATRHTKVPEVPRAPLTITFQHRDEADAAVAAGAKRSSPTQIVLAPAATFFAQYTSALQFIAATEAVLAKRFKQLPGTEAFARELEAMLASPWDQ